jgi:N-methylhydantoinase B
MEIHNIHSGETRQEYSKFSGLRTEIGDVVSYFSPCGGGYGDPLERDPKKVLDDVLDGFINPDHARNDYGVVLTEVDDGYGWALDPAATEALRGEMRA